MAGELAFISAATSNPSVTVDLASKRVARVEENTAADAVMLIAKQIARLNNLTPAAGERHAARNMAVIDH